MDNMRLHLKRLKDIHPYEKNPRKNDKAVSAVVESIQQCEYISPIVVDEDGVILAGHTRYKALKKLGYTEAEVIVKSGLTDEQKRKYRLLDNKTNELAEWDLDLLTDELEGLDFGELDLDWGIFKEEKPKREKEDYLPFENLGRGMFDSVGKYDIPIIYPEHRKPTGEFIPMNYAQSEKNPKGKIAHCFVDDYQFVRYWNAPDKYIPKLKQFDGICAPDFSTYTDMPVAMQIYNHYRKHWLAA